jgi:hypothetical protein
MVSTVLRLKGQYFQLTAVQYLLQQVAEMYSSSTPSAAS